VPRSSARRAHARHRAPEASLRLRGPRAAGRHAAPTRPVVPTALSGIAVGGLTAGLLATGAAPAAAHPISSAATYSPASSTSSYSPTLRQGSRGSAVAVLQRKLGGLVTDGVFGPLTHARVLAYQRSRGLAVDGIVGPQTWGSLGGAGGASVSSASSVSSSSARASRSSTRTAITAAPASYSSSLGAAAVAEAARHVGKPYVYGAAGPNSFDCSGFTQYVFGRLGRSLPHSSAAQYGAVSRVSKSDMRLGDLVFILHGPGGSISHVGIYAGGGTWYVARRTGTTITRQVIYTNDYVVGRVR